MLILFPVLETPLADLTHQVDMVPVGYSICSHCTARRSVVIRGTCSVVDMDTTLPVLGLGTRRRYCPRRLHARDTEAEAASRVSKHWSVWVRPGVGHVQLRSTQENIYIDRSEIDVRQTSPLASARGRHEDSTGDHTYRYHHPPDANTIRLASRPFYPYHISTKSGHTPHLVHLTARHQLHLEPTLPHFSPSTKLHLGSRQLASFFRWLSLHDDGHRGGFYPGGSDYLCSRLRSTYAVPCNTSRAYRRRASWDVVWNTGGM